MDKKFGIKEVVAMGIGTALKNPDILFDNGETFKTGDQIGEIKSDMDKEDTII